MIYAQHYRGLIWTNHAIEKMRDRGLSQQMAWETFSHPDRYLAGRTKGSVEYQKRLGNSRVTVIAKKNEKNEYVVLSAWIDPPLPGSLDAKDKKSYNRYQKSSGFGKWWLTLKRQLGF